MNPREAFVANLSRYMLETGIDQVTICNRYFSYQVSILVSIFANKKPSPVTGRALLFI